MPALSRVWRFVFLALWPRVEQNENHAIAGMRVVDDETKHYANVALQQMIDITEKTRASTADAE